MVAVIDGLLRNVVKTIPAGGKPDFSAYMQSLVKLGAYLREAPVRLDLIPSDLQFDVLAVAAFQETWTDSHLAEDERHLAVKAELNVSTRRLVHNGLLLMAHIAKTTQLPLSRADTQVGNGGKARHYEAAARVAVGSYKTPRQKVLQVLGVILTIAASFTSGMTTGGAVLLTPLPAFIPVIPLAIVIGVAGAIVNWMIFAKPVYKFLNDIMGKDSAFEGFINYVETTDGKKAKLGFFKRLLLVCSIGLAASVGAATAALTYTSVLGMGPFVPLSAIAMLSPLGVSLAIVAFVCVTALMVQGFAEMLQTKNWKDAFVKPFSGIAKVFDETLPQNANKSVFRRRIEKGLTYALTGILTAVGLFGLTMMSYASTQSLGNFLIDVMGVVPSVAVNVSYAVGMGVALLGQVPFILTSIARSIANIATRCRDIFAVVVPPEQQQANNPIVAPQGFGAWLVNGLKVTSNLVISFINAIGNGGLVVPSLIVKGVVLAVASGLAATFNSLAAALSSSTFAVAGPDDIKRDHARLFRLMAIFKAHEPREENKGASLHGSKSMARKIADTTSFFGRGFAKESHIDLQEPFKPAPAARI